MPSGSATRGISRQTQPDSEPTHLSSKNGTGMVPVPRERPFRPSPSPARMRAKAKYERMIAVVIVPFYPPGRGTLSDLYISNYSLTKFSYKLPGIFETAHGMPGAQQKQDGQLPVPPRGLCGKAPACRAPDCARVLKMNNDRSQPTRPSHSVSERESIYILVTTR